MTEEKNILWSIPIVTQKLLQKNVPIEIIQKIVIFAYFDDINAEGCKVCGRIHRRTSHRCQICKKLTCENCGMDFTNAARTDNRGFDVSKTNIKICEKCFSAHIPTCDDKSKCYMCTLFWL
jgi:hypothetical protein